MARAGFRLQLFLTVASILVVVIAASTTVTLLVTRAQAYHAGGDLARAQVDQYTRRGVFAAIVGPENATAVHDLLSEITAQQAVVAVELRDASGRSLGRAGTEMKALRECGFDVRRDVATHIGLTRRGVYWCAVGPIRPRAEDNVRGVRRAGSVVGELRIADSTVATRLMVRELAAWHFGAGMLVLAVGIYLAWRGVRRLTDPLDHLAEVMRQLREGRAKVRAALRGPKEVVTIAAVFNDLLGRVEEEAATLESQVEARTRELRSAWETARAAERYKSVFMSGVTHEMRTPLHVISAHAADVMGELEFLENTGDARSHIGVILKESSELLGRLNQILELARAEATTGAVEPQRIELPVFAEDVRERSLPFAREHGNELQLSCDPVAVVCDRDKLWVIVSNLVTNACKFTRRGIVQIGIRVKGCQLELVVSDTGRGIAKESQQRLWKEFTQADRGEGRAAGFGLGLAIVKRLTEVLQGTVELSSEPGVGTTVRVIIPVDVSPVGLQATEVVEDGTLLAHQRSPQ